VSAAGWAVGLEVASSLPREGWIPQELHCAVKNVRIDRVGDIISDTDIRFSGCNITAELVYL